MKKITKILALTLALVTLALSCTSCGNLFISKKEKEQMAWDIENYSTVHFKWRLVTNKEELHTVMTPEYVKDQEPHRVQCITQGDKMSVTFVLNILGLAYSSNNNIPVEEVILFSIPYEIKSVVSAAAIETIVSEDRKTVTLIYSSENKEVTNRQYRLYDEIVIKYKK